MRLFLTRHGEMESMTKSRAVPNHGITQRGRLQSTLVAKSVVDNTIYIDQLYTGPAARHHETAEQIARTVESLTGDSPDIDERPDLADVRWGEEAVEAFLARGAPSPPWVIREWMAGNMTIQEDIDQVQHRVLNVLDDIVDRQGPDDTVLVTTSAVNIYLVVLDLLGIPPGEVVLNVNNASLFELQYQDDDVALLQVNARTHLPDRLITDAWPRD